MPGLRPRTSTVAHLRAAGAMAAEAGALIASSRNAFTFTLDAIVGIVHFARIVPPICQMRLPLRFADRASWTAFSRIYSQQFAQSGKCQLNHLASGNRHGALRIDRNSYMIKFFALRCARGNRELFIFRPGRLS